MRYHRRADDLIKIIQQPYLIQISHRLRLTTGRSHCCFEVMTLQISQQFISTRLFLYRMRFHINSHQLLAPVPHSMIIKILSKDFFHHRLCKFRRHASKHQTVFHLPIITGLTPGFHPKMAIYLLCIKKDAIHVKNDGSYHSLPSLNRSNNPV